MCRVIVYYVITYAIIIKFKVFAIFYRIVKSVIIKVLNDFIFSFEILVIVFFIKFN
jgi:hypothetical protein